MPTWTGRANHLEIRKYYTQAQLEPYFEANGGKLVSYQQGVSKDTAADVKTILENKINSMGTKDAKVNVLTGVNTSTLCPRGDGRR